MSAVRAETTWYGSYEVIGGEYYARSSPHREDVVWTFDRGQGPYGDPDRIEGGEGWQALDQTAHFARFRVIDSSLDLGPGVPPPILSGARSLWVGADEASADSLCWEAGAGYGNDWRGRAVSEPLAYDGAGDVTLTLLYFSDAEDCFDGTQLYLAREDGSEIRINDPPGHCGPGHDHLGFTGRIGSAAAPAVFARVLTPAQIGGAQEIRFVFEFTSDGGASDEDGRYPTTQGPFCVDDVSIIGGGISRTYDFESGLQGWTPAEVPGIGTFAGISDITCYGLSDLCDCGMIGNVLEAHDGLCASGSHPARQELLLESPIIDSGDDDPTIFFVETNLHGYRAWHNEKARYWVGWRYFPYFCPATGQPMWSDWVGNTWDWWPQLECGVYRWGSPYGEVPETARMIKVSIKVYVPYDAPIQDFTPLFDNIVVGEIPVPTAPWIGFDNGTQFQDVGSWPSDLFDLRAPGPANVTFDKFMSNQNRKDKCGDSLLIIGPDPGTDPNKRWEARLWWRVARKGAFQSDVEDGLPTRYRLWRERVADGRSIDRPYRPEFTWGWMDSNQVGAYAQKNRFISSFREDDDDFAGETSPDNEMLWDDIFLPGTQIQYFITANYRLQPTDYFFLPDTSGGNFLEFEILPGARVANVPGCGGEGFDFCAYIPSILYIDADRGEAQFVIEQALRTILNGEPPCVDPQGCAIPRDRLWDRYDYEDPNSNWKAPFARGSIPGSNNGLTLAQIIGYRTILLNTGSSEAGAMEDGDFRLFDEWLTTDLCGANEERQAFIANGDNVGEILEYLETHGLPFLQSTLGASLVCDAFNGRTSDPDCQPQNASYCVKVLPAPGGSFGTDAQVDAFGNGCPNRFGFSVYGENGGIGNRVYSAEDGLKDASFAQIVREDFAGNYRTVLDGVSWHHMTKRDPHGSGQGLCPRDMSSLVDAGIGEIGAALKWAFGVEDYDSIPKLSSARSLGECEGTWDFPEGVEGPVAGAFVTRLGPAKPNPAGHGTTIPFSLARETQARITIYDLGGREVCRLVDAKLPIGPHSAMWNGRSDEGRRVASGLYWVRLEAGDFVSTMKLAVLR